MPFFFFLSLCSLFSSCRRCPRLFSPHVLFPPLLDKKNQQKATEDFIVHLFEDTNLCAIHAKRVTISEFLFFFF